MKPLATASCCLALALLTFFQFPGHTWLQQDTQIYAPILEHLRDPGVLRNEILVQQPHVAFTLYDEIALGLRGVTGLDFGVVLQAQQVVTRALGIWGLLLLGEALGLGFVGSLFVAAVCSLGAVIAGPAVLTVEYEPTPRAFAIPLLVCAMGLAARARYMGAACAAAVALLYHPPTALPFWGIWVLMVRRVRMVTLAPLGVAMVLLVATSRTQPDTQHFLAALSPGLEALQRMRASYVYVSTWPWSVVAHHLLVFAVLCGAAWRLRRQMGVEARALLLGLAAIGVLSMPLSWVLLEGWKWGIVPQVQPMRTLLFVTFGLQLLAAVAGVRAGRSVEGALWLAAAFLLPLQGQWTAGLVWGRIAVALGLGAAAALAGRWAIVVALGAFLVVPWAGVVNYPRQHSAELDELSAWARGATPADAVFLFADGGRSGDPGIFRTKALRAIYADWKGGGQVNYLSDFGEQWYFRWQQTAGKRYREEDLPRYEALGVQYVVLGVAHRLARPAEFANGKYVAYRLR